jgi:hypothetical protein
VAIVLAPATTGTTTRGGRGTRAPEERDRCSRRRQARLLSTGADKDVIDLGVVHMSSMAPQPLGLLKPPPAAEDADEVTAPAPNPLQAQVLTSTTTFCGPKP